MPQDKVDIVRGIYDEWAKGNLRAGADLYDQDVILIPRKDIPDSGRYLGPDGIREFMRGWLEAWTDFTITADEFIEAGDSIVVGVRQRAVGKRSGAPAEMPHFQVWTFRGRSIIRLQLFAHRGEALDAVGLPASESSGGESVGSANIDLLQSIYAAWEEGDFSSGEWAHPEIEYVIADGPDPGSWKGLAGMAEAMRTILSAWEDFRGVAEEYRELDDERVLVLTRRTGRGKTSGLELGQMRAKAAQIFHVRGGKVTRVVTYWDRERALADLGLRSEAPP
jgi:uncharacterized protein